MNRCPFYLLFVDLCIYSFLSVYYVDVFPCFVQVYPPYSSLCNRGPRSAEGLLGLLRRGRPRTVCPRALSPGPNPHDSGEVIDPVTITRPSIIVDTRIYYVSGHGNKKYETRIKRPVWSFRQTVDVLLLVL